jgi:putative transposase
MRLAWSSARGKPAVTYRLIARFRQRPQTSSLLLAKAGRPVPSACSIHGSKPLVEQAIKTFYLSPQRPSIRALVREIALNCETEKLPAPTFRTIKRRLAELDPQLITKTRLGARKAQELYRPVRPWHSDELLPLELVQIDHTQLHVMVVDESQRRVLGRPWLTLAIDVASRVVTGFYVSLDAPAAISVALVLTHAVLPKDLWLADRQLDLSWPVAGVPETLHLDNAPEFDSQALVRGTQEYGIALQHRPPNSRTSASPPPTSKPIYPKITIVRLCAWPWPNLPDFNAFMNWR